MWAEGLELESGAQPAAGATGFSESARVAIGPNGRDAGESCDLKVHGGAPLTSWLGEGPGAGARGSGVRESVKTLRQFDKM